MWRVFSIAAAVTLASACGGSDSATGPNPQPQPVPPARVVILDASASWNPDYYRDEVVLSLRNEGGEGEYRLDLWGRSSSAGPFGPAYLLGTTQPVRVLQGYNETVGYYIGEGFNVVSVWMVRLYTRPVNTAIWTQTDCRTVRVNGSCP